MEVKSIDGVTKMQHKFIDLSPAVIKFDASHGNALSEKHCHLCVLERPISTAPGSCSSVIPSFSVMSKNFDLIQCSISHLPTV